MFLIYLRLGLFAAAGIALWFAYGWGVSIIDTYNSNITKIERLERDKALIESRVASYQTLIERYKAAIDQSTCKARIQYLLKNPDLLKKVDPFKPDLGN